MISFAIIFALASASTASARDASSPDLAAAKLAWSYQANAPPSPAFRGGLATWRNLPRVEPIRCDYAYHPAASGGRIFFGSSTEEALFCLDARTGQPRWTFYTEGPVRLAPTLWEGRVYCGSDDGKVYCLDQATGRLVWERRVAPSDRRAIGNGRLISAWPVRTSVAIADGSAYVGAGLFPPQGAYLCAVDARSGRIQWRREIPYSPYGDILVDGDQLLVATGRTCPAEFRRSDGQPRIIEPNPRRAEGASRLARAGEWIYWGPSESGLLHLRVRPDPVPGLTRDVASATTRGWVVRTPGWRFLADECVYLVRDDQILAAERERFRQWTQDWCDARGRAMSDGSLPKQQFGVPAAGQLLRETPGLFEAIRRDAAWSIPNDRGYRSAALSGRVLIAGGDGVVTAIDTRTGGRLWSHPVQGVAWGLAIDDDALYVSTDRGWIYGFRPGVKGEPRRHLPVIAEASPREQWIVESVDIALENTPARKGHCLVVGEDGGRLACEIARRSAFLVVVLARDDEQAAAIRDRLTRAGVYGDRVVVRRWRTDASSDPPYYANLIVLGLLPSEERSDAVLQAMLRRLHPYGGAILLDGAWSDASPAAWRAEGLSAPREIRDGGGRRWLVGRREAPPGAGQWSHIYADPANTGCSGDRLIGPNPALQWFGPPGAEDVVERHAVAMPPLFERGKLFLAGARDTIQAVDAYNGAALWKIEAPQSTRKMISHNAGFMAAAEDVLFVAAARSCWMLDAETGVRKGEFAGIRPESDWGYVAAAGGRLLGSNQKPAADEYSSGRRREGIQFLVRARDLVSRPTVSENLFAYDYRTRKLVWTCDRGSAILNTTITVGGDRVYFAESGNAAATGDLSGAVLLSDFFASQSRLVALSLDSGRELWSKNLSPLSPLPEDEHEHMMFLSYADGKLLCTRTGHIRQKLSYRLRALDAGSGDEVWERVIPSRHRVYAPLIYGKNGQQSHPSIVGGRVYLLSHITDALITIDLATGAISRDPELYQFWIHSKTCAVPTASADRLFFRRNSCHMFDISSGRLTDLTGVTRPGCWMSIIPAGGLVLMPEASAGCTCGFSLQTSVVFAGRR